MSGHLPFAVAVNTTDVVIDIDGSLAPVSGSTLPFSLLPPCRVAHTRKRKGDFNEESSLVRNHSSGPGDDRQRATDDRLYRPRPDGHTDRNSRKLLRSQLDRDRLRQSDAVGLHQREP